MVYVAGGGDIGEYIFVILSVLFCAQVEPRDKFKK